jgi:hypothetical protein
MDEARYWLAKNMICIPNKENKVTDKEIENFISKYREIIDNVISCMPRGMSNVGAAVAKCAIQFDKDKAISFLRNSKERIFQGKEDPVYHFHLWLLGLKGPKRKKHDVSTYEITFYACKNYCLGKKIKRLYQFKDNSNWNDQFEIVKKNDNIDQPKKELQDFEFVAEFIKKLEAQNISANDFIAALQKKKKSS